MTTDKLDLIDQLMQSLGFTKGEIYVTQRLTQSYPASQDEMLLWLSSRKAGQDCCKELLAVKLAELARSGVNVTVS